MPTTALPHTWRPLGTRIVGAASMGTLIVVMIAAWVFFPPEIRAKFTFLQVATLVLMVGLVGLAYFAVLRSRVTVAEEGVVVVNGFKRRDYEWAQLISVSLRRGAPWATIDLSDGETISAIGIQASDGDRAKLAVRQFRKLIQEHSAQH